MTYRGQILNGVVTLDEGERLPEGARVEVRVVDSPADGAMDLSTKLLRHAGAITDLPEDAAQQLDHYLTQSYTGRMVTTAKPQA